MRVCRLYFEDLISQEEDLNFFCSDTYDYKTFQHLSTIKKVLWITGEPALALAKLKLVGYAFPMPKRTYQPKKKKRARTHGFRKRMQTSGGQKVIKRRRVKKRSKLTV